MSKFPAPPIRTPFIGNPPKSELRNVGQQEDKNVPSWPWIQFFQAVTNFLSSPQIPQSTPASSTATGTAGTVVFDANFLYIAVGKNQWKRVSLSAF